MNEHSPKDLASDMEPTAAQRRLDEEELRIRAAYQRRSPVRDAREYPYFKEAILLKVHALEREMLRGLRRAGIQFLATSRILEVGCGRGDWLRQLIQWGAASENLIGIDLLPEPIAEADTCRSGRSTPLREGCPSSFSRRNLRHRDSTDRLQLHPRRRR